jgi:hypothetical protein
MRLQTGNGRRASGSRRRRSSPLCSKSASCSQTENRLTHKNSDSPASAASGLVSPDIHNACCAAKKGRGPTKLVRKASPYSDPGLNMGLGLACRPRLTSINKQTTTEPRVFEHKSLQGLQCLLAECTACLTTSQRSCRTRPRRKSRESARKNNNNQRLPLCRYGPIVAISVP